MDSLFLFPTYRNKVSDFLVVKRTRRFLNDDRGAVLKKNGGQK